MLGAPEHSKVLLPFLVHPVIKNIVHIKLSPFLVHPVIKNIVHINPGYKIEWVYVKMIEMNTSK